MLYARVYRTIPGVAVHKFWRWGAGVLAGHRTKNEEPIGVATVRFRNLNIWAAVRKWKFIHAKKFVLVNISKAEYDTDLAFGLWPELTLIRYPNWIWWLKKTDWLHECARLHHYISEYQTQIICWLVGITTVAISISMLLVWFGK